MLVSTPESGSRETCADAGPRSHTFRRPGAWQPWWRFRRNRPALVGLLVVGVYLLAVAAPGLLASGAESTSRAPAFAPPGASHLMGTDDLGRDLATGVVRAAQTSLRVGFAAAAISIAIGVVVGAVAGFFGGAIDSALSGTMEWFQVIPRFFLALVLVAIWGATTGNIIVAIGILSWPLTARLVRAEVLSLKERDFVVAARAIGVKDSALIYRHILPNALPPVVVNGSLEVGNAILLEAGMSFLGLGGSDSVSWGAMLFNAQGFLRRAWWMSVFPGVAIFFIVMSLNLVGDGLNDACNPRLPRG